MRALSRLGMTAFALATLFAARTSSATPLYYYGGRVISNVEIVEVAWTAAVDPNYQQQLSGFYKAIITSSFMDWMTEYDTFNSKGYADQLPGSNQHIGRGTFGGIFVIDPAIVDNTLQDSQIQTELAAQLAAGKLPAPKLDAGGNVNSLYMIDFPPGYAITIEGIHSCQDFGAYHFTISYGGKSVPYGVHPNCGYPFDAATIVHSHELAEAMTDTEVGLANQAGPTSRPAAWVTLAANTNDSLEAADLCEGTNDQIAGYYVQKVWSNYAGGCVSNIPICDGSVQPPSCRPCNGYDSGQACAAPNAACATTGPKAGQCVLCTSAFASACTGATPVCNNAVNTCVGCVKNTDCPMPSTSICDAMTMTCRGCTSKSDCVMPDAPVCDVSADSQLGQCVGCNIDGDCSGGQVCQEHACTTPGSQSTTSSGSMLPPNPVGGGDAGFTDAPIDGDGSVVGSCACRTAFSPSDWSSKNAGLLAFGLLIGVSAARKRRSTR